MFSSKTFHAIKQRKVASDVFYTPHAVSKLAIDLIEVREDDVWLDPWKGGGSFYDQFPTQHKEFCEITDGLDFIEYDGHPNVICSNPPYSKLNDCFRKIIELRPRVVSLLLGVLNLTPRRMQWMNDAGYGLTTMHMLKVHSWFGMSVILQWELGQKNVLTYDRLIYR
jgi:hypothetical protein